MASNLFVFFLTCLIYSKSSSSVPQKNVFFLVNVGQAVTLECSSENQISRRIVWYKQILGKNPELISSFYILNLQFSDSATYNCLSYGSYTLTFLKSYTIHVKDASFYLRESVDLSSMQEAAWTRDSVTLNCTVHTGSLHTGSCDGEHRVYWFKDSGDSHPGLIYTHKGRNDQCERNNDAQTHSCVYNLHMKNLTESNAGIYYCAVVSCGHILFGNGTKLELFLLCSSWIHITFIRQKNDLNTVCVYAGVRLQN
uniref:Ig-like domain-containing protein n=1 Tax=Oryzias melastigma TaxID=30732 RepID=A0A3B3DIF0_ORYME